MTVYTIARPMVKKEKEPTDRKKYELRTYMVTIFTSNGAQAKDVCAYFDSEFEKSDEHADGWRLTGLHAISEFHQGHMKKWAPYIAPVPPAMTAVIKDSHPHLRLVRP